MTNIHLIVHLSDGCVSVFKLCGGIADAIC